jgi:general secretion pathway protein G
MRKSVSGFTIVELLIVIIVIGILATLTVVAYNGVQTRSANLNRKTDLSAVSKALDLYFLDNGRYPPVVGGFAGQTCISPGGWNCWGAGTTNRILPTQYQAVMPQDPKYVDDGKACDFPNPHGSRLYGYVTDTNGTGYILATYMPGLATTDRNYFDGSVNMGCINFANYLIRENM